MPDANSRYTTEIHFVVIGQDDGKRDARINAEYFDLNYEKLVAIEAVMLEAIGKLHQLGIEIAGEIGGPSSKGAAAASRKG